MTDAQVAVIEQLRKAENRFRTRRADLLRAGQVTEAAGASRYLHWVERARVAESKERAG